MPNIMEIIVRAVDQASNVLNNIGKQGEQATKNLEKSFQNAGKAMTNAGKTLTTYVTAPLTGLATVSVATVAKFDDSMSQVAAISGATGKDLERLRDLAKDLGAATRYSASEAADAMTYLALAGYDTNQILEATPGMLNLAAAAGMDLATAADIVTDTMSGFQMSAERAGEAADIFAAASSMSNTNVEQLGEAMKYASSTANAAGMDLAQTAAILGVFADSGVKGSMAGTTFNAILRDMKSKAEDGAIAIGDMSIAIYNADGTMRDLGSIMADVEQATQNMTTAQRDAALGAVFGSEAMRGVNILLATGSERYKELEQAMYNSAGAAEEMSDIMEDNLAGAFRALKSKMEGILIQIGEQLTPILRDTIIPLLSDFGEKISNLIEWFAGLDESTQRTIITVTAIIAALGPVLVVIGKITSSVGTMIGVFGKLNSAWGAVSSASGLLSSSMSVLLGPVGLVIAAIAAAAAIGWYLYNNWEEITAKATELWETFTAWFSELWEGISTWFSELINGIAEFFTNAWQGLLDWFGEVCETFKEVTSVAWNWIKDFFTEWWPLILGIFTGGVGLVIGLVIKNWEEIKEFTQNLWNSISDFFTELWNTIQALFSGGLEAIWGFISDTWNSIVNITNELWDGIKEFLSDTWTSMANTTRDWVGKLYTWAVEEFENLWKYIKDIPSQAIEWGKDIINGLWDGMKEIWANVTEWFSNAISKIGSSIKSAFSGGGGGSSGGSGGNSSRILTTPEEKEAFRKANPDMPYWLGGGKIERFHSGGIFRAKTPGGEGLALLRDGERVSRPTESIIDYERLGQVLAQYIKPAFAPQITVKADGGNVNNIIRKEEQLLRQLAIMWEVQ